MGGFALLVVGEKINASRKAVKEAVQNQDAAFIRNLARQQAEGGANYIDINCGTFLDREGELLKKKTGSKIPRSLLLN
jgi:cobalamin-dependent methionine synthase I